MCLYCCRFELYPVKVRNFQNLSKKKKGLGFKQHRPVEMDNELNNLLEVKGFSVEVFNFFISVKEQKRD